MKSRPDNDFNATLYGALRALGWFLPETEAEVLATEEREDLSAELLPELADPLAVFEPRVRRGQAPVSPTAAPDADITDALARAARLGQQALTPDVEEAMRRDRESAEKAKRSTHND